MKGHVVGKRLCTREEERNGRVRAEGVYLKKDRYRVIPDKNTR